MSDLLHAQQRFAGMLASLIWRAVDLGFGVTLGEVWRSPDEAKRQAAEGRGIVNSLHCDRLAVDLNLFQGDEWLTDCDSYRPLGEYWESIGGAWGGRFSRVDPGHFSLPFGGRK